VTQPPLWRTWRFLHKGGHDDWGDGSDVRSRFGCRAVVVCVGVMVDAHPEIAEMDCNPVTVLPDRAVIVDARVRVREAPAERPVSAREGTG
jgi:hypothetical protein